MSDFSYELHKLDGIQREIDNLARLSHQVAKSVYLAPLLISAMSVVRAVYQGDSQAEREIRFYAEGINSSSDIDLNAARYAIEKAKDAIHAEGRTRSDQLAAATIALSRVAVARQGEGDSIGPAPNSSQQATFISQVHIAALKRVPRCGLDPTRLQRLLEEINIAFRNECYLSVCANCRTVLNHVPPVFGHDTFAQVAANAERSLRETFTHLEDSLRKIADGHTHEKMRAVESVPQFQQINFSQSMDKLIEEVVRRLRLRAEQHGTPGFGVPDVSHKK